MTLVVDLCLVAGFLSVLAGVFLTFGLGVSLMIGGAVVVAVVLLIQRGRSG